MTLDDQFDGSADPFEGDRTTVWRSLPSNAVVTKATLSVTPVAAQGARLFEETIPFQNGQGSFGATMNATPDFVEIDFHRRRTLAAVAGTTAGANLQVDLGGLYVELNDKGAIRVPNDTLFAVPADGSLPGLTVSKFKLTPPTPLVTVNVSSVTIHSAPTNLTVRVGTLGPFWSRPGELSSSDSSPDFSVVLLTYLAHAKVANGFYTIPLVVHSDNVARLRMELHVEFVAQAALQPDGIKEVVVPFDFDTVAKSHVNVLSAQLPPNARVLPGLTTSKVIGSFNETRIVHGVAAGSPAPPYAVTVSAGESQGQVVSPDNPISASAVDVLLTAVNGSAELVLDLRRDLAGKPDGVSVLSRPVQFHVNSSVPRLPTWVSVPLPLAFNFANANGSGKAVYWLVLSSLEGEVLWSTIPSSSGSIGVQHTLDGGLSWHYSGALHTSGPLDASYRLRNKPAVFEVPVQLQVGAGDHSARVNLDRYQPLGKLDFTIDTPDFSDAFNQYLSTAVAPGCPQGEQLVNGNFEQWAVSGNEIGAATSINVSGSTAALATTADGRWTYVVGAFGNAQQMGVRIIDNVCRSPLAEAIQLQMTDDPLGIAVNPARDRLYIVCESGLYVVDAIARAQLGPPVAPASLPVVNPTTAAIFLGEIAVSPEGGLVYLTLGPSPANSVLTIDAGALDQVVQGQRTLVSGDVRSLPLSGATVEAMSLSPDGRLLYVALSPTTEVTVIDTASWRTGNPIGVTDQPGAIDFTPDGKLALVLTSGNDTRLHLVDTAAEADSGAIVLGTDSPVAVLASPDSTRGYSLLSPAGNTGVTAGGGSLIPVELRTRRPGTAVPLDIPLDAMAITAQGDSIYVIGGRTGTVTVIPVGERTPAEWFVTSGTPSTPARVLPVCLGATSPVDLAVAFGRSARPFQPNTVAAGLSQVVPASGPCSYDFSFFAYSDDPGALAEIFWLDDKSKLLRTDSQPIQVQSASDSSFSVLEARRFIAVPTPLLLHRAHFTSPDGTAQAEVRFSTPALATLLLGRVSLAGTSEALTNGDLQLIQNGVLAGWTLTSQSARGVSLSPIAGGMRLLNFSAGNAELMQSTPIVANQQFVWELKASATPGQSQQAPAAELLWLKADGSAAGPSTLLPLESDGFLRYPASGTTPAGTTVVEVHLKTPAGTGLDIYQVSLQTPQAATVPLTFISQAPGELRVSRSQVTYDVVAVPPPPVPSQGLATPTAPGAKPGDPPCNSYCSCCGDDQPITNPKSRLTPAGRPMTIGSCVVCGSQLARPGGPLVAGAPIFHTPLLPPHRAVAGRPAFLPPTAPLPPLTALPGIREGRLRQLAEAGITSLEHLADATPDLVAKAMRGISPKLAVGFIARAKALIASHGGSSTTTRSDLAPPRSPVITESQKEN